MGDLPGPAPEGIGRRALLSALALGGAAYGLGLSAGHASAAVRRGPKRVEIPPAPRTLIRDVTVVDPATGASTPSMSVLVRDGRIAAVGRDLPVGAEDYDAVVDGEGRFVVPGYINMHTHAIQADHPELLMATMLAEGVTGMRQMLGTPELLRHRAERRLPLSEKAPALLSMPGDLLLPFNASSTREVRREIDRQWDQGADFIKMVMVEREVFFEAVSAAHARGMRIAGHLPPSVTVREAIEAGFDCIEHLGTGSNMWIACARDEAEQWAEHDTSIPIPSIITRLPAVDGVISDIFTAASAKRLINPAAYDSEDAVRELGRALDAFDDAKARKLARDLAGAGAWQSPTLSCLRTHYLMDLPEYEQDQWLTRMSENARRDYYSVLEKFRSLPSWMRDTYRRAYESTVGLMRIWHEEGVPILAGTDGEGRSPGQWMQAEFAQLAAAGLSPLEVLRSATTTPATYLRLRGRVGSVQVGAEADLLLLGSDPLARVENLGDITTVVRAGHLQTRRELAESVDAIAATGTDPGLRKMLARARTTCCGR